MDIYLVKKDIKIFDIILDTDDAADARRTDKAHLLRMIENNQTVCSVAMRFDMPNNKIWNRIPPYFIKIPLPNKIDRGIFTFNFSFPYGVCHL